MLRARCGDAPSAASTGSGPRLALRCRQLCSHVREEALGGHPQALQRYALAVLSHIALLVAWYLFVKLGEVPKFVMPSPYETVHALLVPNYRWPENIAVTTVEIFGGYILAVVFGIGAALLFAVCRADAVHDGENIAAEDFDRRHGDVFRPAIVRHEQRVHRLVGRRHDEFRHLAELDEEIPRDE